MKETKREKRRIYGRFVFMLLCCALIGGILGYSVEAGTVDLAQLGDRCNRVLRGLGLWWFAPGFVLLAVSSGCYLQGKRQLSQVEDDGVFECVDRRLNAALVAAGIAGPWMVLAIALSFGALDRNGFAQLLGVLACIVVYCVWISALQALTVEAIKRMRPEKQGNVFDRRFQKNWYQSCDEAERQLIGACSYHTMMAMNRVFPVVMVFLCLLSLFQLAAPVWVLLVGGLWLIQQGTYLYMACALDPARRKR